MPCSGAIARPRPLHRADRFPRYAGMAQDPYETLGVSRTATPDEIRKAFRKIAKKNHPDLNPGDNAAEERFKAANTANEILSDPERRAQFDRGEIDASGQEQRRSGLSTATTRRPTRAGATTARRRQLRSRGSGRHLRRLLCGARRRRGGGTRPRRGADRRYRLRSAVPVRRQRRHRAADPARRARRWTCASRPASRTARCCGCAARATPDATAGRTGDALIEVARAAASVLPAARAGTRARPAGDDGRGGAGRQGAGADAARRGDADRARAFRRRARGCGCAAAASPSTAGRRRAICMSRCGWSPGRRDPALESGVARVGGQARRASIRARRCGGRHDHLRSRSGAAAGAGRARRCRIWIAQDWVRPQRRGGELMFAEIDVARLHLILDLRDTLEVGEGAMPVVLSLLDQLHETRRQMRRLCEALDAGRPAEALRQAGARLQPALSARRAQSRRLGLRPRPTPRQSPGRGPGGRCAGRDTRGCPRARSASASNCRSGPSGAPACPARRRDGRRRCRR